MFDFIWYLIFDIGRFIQDDIIRPLVDFLNKYYFVFRFLTIITLFLVIYPISLFTIFTYSNCWIYAINQYIQFNGYIVFRKTKWNRSKWFWWEHALWSPDLKTFYTYVPRKRKKLRLIPPIIFIGDIIVMDSKEKPIIHIENAG